LGIKFEKRGRKRGGSARGRSRKGGLFWNRAAVGFISSRREPGRASGVSSAWVMRQGKKGEAKEDQRGIGKLVTKVYGRKNSSGRGKRRREGGCGGEVEKEAVLGWGAATKAYPAGRTTLGWGGKGRKEVRQRKEMGVSFSAGCLAKHLSFLCKH